MSYMFSSSVNKKFLEMWFHFQINLLGKNQPCIIAKMSPGKCWRLMKTASTVKRESRPCMINTESQCLKIQSGQEGRHVPVFASHQSSPLEMQLIIVGQTMLWACSSLVIFFWSKYRWWQSYTGRSQVRSYALPLFFGCLQGQLNKIMCNMNFLVLATEK